jgi:hypothetical protein
MVTSKLLQAGCKVLRFSCKGQNSAVVWQGLRQLLLESGTTGGEGCDDTQRTYFVPPFPGIWRLANTLASI